jgi:pantetheine-phosphate adenylyltransferase/16S rRNA (guanine(966)-N(2))-methyltransferase RsmD
MTRIIAGTAGGRRLETPPGEATRPTSDRVREALFSTLDARNLLSGARVLDLFAGSGALGLEAASRGACEVVLVDSSRQAVAVARRNAALVAPARVAVVLSSALRHLGRPPDHPMDVVFLDPPYALGEPALTEHLVALLANGWLDRDTIVVVERSGRSPEPCWPPGLGREQVRRYGETAVWTASVTDPLATPSGHTGHTGHTMHTVHAGRTVHRCVCPGSFDPVTNGHVDVVRRATALFDEVVVAVVANPAKAGMFTVEERLELLQESVGDLPGVRVDAVEEGRLLVDYCRRMEAAAVVKGLRSGTDFAYELPMALMNRHLTGLETVFLPGEPQLEHVSSSLVKEVAGHGGDVAGLVPDGVLKRLRARLAGQS